MVGLTNCCQCCKPHMHKSGSLLSRGAINQLKPTGRKPKNVTSGVIPKAQNFILNSLVGLRPPLLFILPRFLALCLMGAENLTRARSFMTFLREPKLIRGLY